MLIYVHGNCFVVCDFVNVAGSASYLERIEQTRQKCNIYVYCIYKSRTDTHTHIYIYINIY